MKILQGLYGLQRTFSSKLQLIDAIHTFPSAYYIQKQMVYNYLIKASTILFSTSITITYPLIHRIFRICDTGDLTLYYIDAFTQRIYMKSLLPFTTLEELIICIRHTKNLSIDRLIELPWLDYITHCKLPSEYTNIELRMKNNMISSIPSRCTDELHQRQQCKLRIKLCRKLEYEIRRKQSTYLHILNLKWNNDVQMGLHVLNMNINKNVQVT
jgi:hypothetical protein